MANVQFMDRERLMRDYDLQLDKEFKIGDSAAAWAPGDSGPRFWDEEDALITLEQGDANRGNVESVTIALSPDECYLAISTNAVIRIYDVQSRQMRGELVGHLSNVHSLHFAPANSADGVFVHGQDVKYVLLSEGAEVGGGDGQVVVWHLGADGYLMNETTPLATGELATRAMTAISDDLWSKYNIPESEITLIKQAFAEAWKNADLRNRVSHLPVYEGHLPSFGSQPISHDGRHMLYIAHGDTTQGGMRPPEDLPQIVVINLADKKERCRLQGHEDAIMWAGWSQDDKTIVTASWDETFKIWDASIGHCRHTIGPTGGQNWAGGFSPDGKNVLLSGGGQVAIYDIETGVKAFELDLAALGHQRGWIRELQWNPQSEDVALVIGRTVVLWEPGADASETVFALHSDGSMLDDYNSPTLVQWLDGGKKLAVTDTDDTVFVWDREKDVKWRFQRPRGTESEYHDEGVFYVAEQKMCIALNGDGVVRYWKL